MLSGLSFYLVPKLLASDLILTVDAAAGKAGIWPGGSLQNSEFISGDTFLLPTCLRGRDKRAPRLCLCRVVCLQHGHGSRPCPRTRTRPPRTEPSRGRPAPAAAPRYCQGLCPPAPAFPGSAGTRRSFNPPFGGDPHSRPGPLLKPARAHACRRRWHRPRRRRLRPGLSPAEGSAVSRRSPCRVLTASGRTQALPAPRAQAGFQEKPPFCWKCRGKRDGRRSSAGVRPPPARCLPSKQARSPAFLLCIPPEEPGLGNQRCQSRARWESSAAAGRLAGHRARALLPR